MQVEVLSAVVNSVANSIRAHAVIDVGAGQVVLHCYSLHLLCIYVCARIYIYIYLYSIICSVFIYFDSRSFCLTYDQMAELDLVRFILTVGSHLSTSFG